MSVINMNAYTTGRYEETFENTTFLEIKKNLLEALKELPAIHTGAREGDLIAMRRYREFMLL
jgi:hypothetical protein